MGKVAYISVIICFLCVPCLGARIHDAIIAGEKAVVESLIEKDPGLVALQDKEGMTPLHWAVFAGSLDMTDYLLVHGADVNVKNNIGETPLHLAVMLNNIKMVELLISKGANPRISDKAGATPLSLATKLERNELAGILVRRSTESREVNPMPREVVNPDVWDMHVFERKPGLAQSRAVRYIPKKVLSYQINTLVIDLFDSRVSVSAAIPEEGIGSSESLESFTKRLKPTALINGTFFCPSTLRPAGDIVVNGSRVYSGGCGTALCIGKDYSVGFVTIRPGQQADWSGWQTVIMAGPTLVRDGKLALKPSEEGITNPMILGTNSRSAVGITKDNRLILANCQDRLSLSKWAEIMMAIGCTSAVNLDGGAAMCLYYRGKTIVAPASKLTNVLVVYESSASN